MVTVQFQIWYFAFHKFIFFLAVMALSQMTILDSWVEVGILYIVFLNIQDMTDIKLVLKFFTNPWPIVFFPSILFC